MVVAAGSQPKHGSGGGLGVTDAAHNAIPPPRCESQQNALLADNQFQPVAIAIDATHIYWAVSGEGYGGGQIRRLRLTTAASTGLTHTDARSVAPRSSCPGEGFPAIFRRRPPLREELGKFEQFSQDNEALFKMRQFRLLVGRVVVSAATETGDLHVKTAPLQISNQGQRAGHAEALCG